MVRLRRAPGIDTAPTPLSVRRPSRFPVATVQRRSNSWRGMPEPSTRRVGSRHAKEACETTATGAPFGSKWSPRVDSPGGQVHGMGSRWGSHGSASIDGWKSRLGICQASLGAAGRLAAQGSLEPTVPIVPTDFGRGRLEVTVGTTSIRLIAASLGG